MKNKKKFIFPQISYNDAIKIGPEKFCKKYLFPTMRRESGRGFGMQWWRFDFLNIKGEIDYITRTPPSCDTAHCIGGTIEAIIKKDSYPTEYNSSNKIRILGAILGLDFRCSWNLFYEWMTCWKYRDAYNKAKTTTAKEKIAEKQILLTIEKKRDAFIGFFK